jgi:hypothetical protein
MWVSDGYITHIHTPHPLANNWFINRQDKKSKRAEVDHFNSFIYFLQFGSYFKHKHLVIESKQRNFFIIITLSFHIYHSRFHFIIVKHRLMRDANEKYWPFCIRYLIITCSCSSLLSKELPFSYNYFLQFCMKYVFVYSKREYTLESVSMSGRPAVYTITLEGLIRLWWNFVHRTVS